MRIGSIGPCVILEATTSWLSETQLFFTTMWMLPIQRFDPTDRSLVIRIMVESADGSLLFNQAHPPIQLPLHKTGTIPLGMLEFANAKQRVYHKVVLLAFPVHKDTASKPTLSLRYGMKSVVSNCNRPRRLSLKVRPILFLQVLPTVKVAYFPAVMLVVIPSDTYALRYVPGSWRP